ncbi:MAG: hypothetical protein EOM77_04420 [Bacteroidia bacterium]|nr:hypothetical protein [Bacteroidia bacterium]
MQLIKKYGPYVSIGLIILVLGFLFLPYVRGGYDNAYYANGYTAIFNIKESAIPSNITNKGGPSVLLIIAFVLMVLSLIGLPFHGKDPVIAFVIGIALCVSGLLFLLAHLILYINLHMSAISATFPLYLIGVLVSVSGVISLLAGIQNLKDDYTATINSRHSYIRK